MKSGMSEQKRIFTLIVIMIGVSLLITGFTLFSQYRTAFHEEQRRLVETVESQARIIGAMAKFDERYSQSYVPGGARGATLAKINEAHNNYEQSGMTMEFALAEHRDGMIVFLIHHRHGGLEDFLKPVRFDSAWAQPMRMALSGNSGTMIGKDYRGVTVLAAYEPVNELGIGAVAKIDLSEIRAPFIREGLVSAIFAILIVSVAVVLVFRISRPMVEKIDRQNEQLRETNRLLQKEINERIVAEESLQDAHAQLEVKVRQRTAELSDANELLKKEVADRKMAERELQKNESMLKKVFDGIQDPLILMDRNMHVLMMNRAATDYYKASTADEVVGRICCGELMGNLENGQGGNVGLAIRQGQPATYERAGMMDSERIESVVAYPIMDEGGNMASVITRISDITEKKLFERQLVQKEKLAALGIMVSSMAHEINNPNSFISFNIPILKDYIREMLPITADYAAAHPDFEVCNLPYAEFEKDIVNLLTNIENGSKRISTFISNLREYSHDKSQASRMLVDLTYVIESVLSICGSKIKKSIKTFIKNVPEDLPSISAQPYAIEQIMINFLINACHAADKDDAWIQLDVTVENEAQHQLCIAVSDNGQGMDEKTQTKIFDPFFSTKSPEGGTGLGLFVCHTLARRMDGHIDVFSQPGQGSRFVLVLPIHDQEKGLPVSDADETHRRASALVE